MKTIARLAAAAALAGLAASAGFGCQAKGSPPPGDPPAPPPAAAAAAAPAPAAAYAGDIAKLCDVRRLSGADTDPASDPRLPIANWLAANLTTDEARRFLARIQPLVGVEKAEALEAEARRVGLSGCTLAAEWRDSATP